MMFQNPYAFFLLLGIPFIFILKLKIKKKESTGIPFPSVSLAQGIPKSFRQRLEILKPLLLILAIIFLVIAIARPRYGIEELKDINKGIAIEMVVDRSGSMGAEIQYGGNSINRLDAVKSVFSSFILGDGKDLKGRPDDLVGMISFARYADTVYPLSLSHNTLNSFLQEVTLVNNKNEDGTAIGDALSLAAARLKTVNKNTTSAGSKNNYTIKSKIIILLTDGQNNWGKRSPIQAAQLAKDWGIKIYAIGIGGGNSWVTINTIMGKQRIPTRSDLDVDTLTKVAKLTGGSYFSADNVKNLKAVYTKINKLEKSEIESVKYVDYKEAFSPFALLALIFISMYIIFSITLLRRIP